MDAPFGMERRDPFAGLLRLGTLLFEARRAGRSGVLAVRDGARVHEIRISGGAVVRVLSDGRVAADSATEAEWILSSIAHLFGLERPHVLWEPASRDRPITGVDPSFAVVAGVLGRLDLFEPIPLVERIPVAAIAVDERRLAALGALRLSRTEQAFLARLAIPTAVPIALWKRGLDPRHAGALIVALNLLGAFEGMWKPGDLPRDGKVREACASGAANGDDFGVLGLGPEAAPKEVDRAFRRLSWSLHPDRLLRAPAAEAKQAEVAYQIASEAYHRIKRSRRQRPLAGPASETIGQVTLVRRPRAAWWAALVEARGAASRGEWARARAFALKGLAALPPESAKRELLAIVRRAA